MSKLNVELVTPEALIISSDVEMVVVPGSEGDFGVLSGHSPMISTLRPGVIDVYENSSSQLSRQIFISDGFAEVTKERCTILSRREVDVTGNPDEAKRLVEEAVK